MSKLLPVALLLFSIAVHPQEKKPGLPPNKGAPEHVVTEGKVIYSVRANGATMLFVMDGTVRKHWFDKPLTDIHEESKISLSLDGEKVAYTAKDEKIYIMDRKGVRTRLTGKTYTYRNKEHQKQWGNKELLSEKSPAWSPDGRSIAFTGRPSEKFKYCIYITDIAGKETRLLNSGHEPAWSPDSKHVAYSRREGTQWNFAIFESDVNGKERRITDFGKDHEGKSDLAYSPKGNEIAFVVEGKIFITPMPRVEGERDRVVSESPEKKLVRPVWSPDGTKFLYRLGDKDTDREYMIHEIKSGDTQVIDLGANSRHIAWLKSEKDAAQAKVRIEKKAAEKVAFTLKEYDVDNDGKLSREEWKEDAKVFDEWDKSGDGYLSREELMACFRAHFSMQTEQERE